MGANQHVSVVDTKKSVSHDVCGAPWRRGMRDRSNSSPSQGHRSLGPDREAVDERELLGGGTKIRGRRRAALVLEPVRVLGAALAGGIAPVPRELRERDLDELPIGGLGGRLKT